MRRRTLILVGLVSAAAALLVTLLLVFVLFGASDGSGGLNPG